MRYKDDEANKNVKYTTPWGGGRGPGFRKFKRDLRVSCQAVYLHDDDYSLWQAMTGMDQGGPGNGADAMPAQGANGYTNAFRKRRKRQAKAYTPVEVLARLLALM